MTPAQLWRLNEFRRRIEYVGESYKFWKEAEEDRPTFNESLKLLHRAWESPNRKRREPVRLHPMIEIGISIIAFHNRADRLRDFNPNQAEIETASRELLRRTKPLRGRPQDMILRYHVRGLILACEWTTGTPVTASPTTNSEYDPQMTSDGAKSIEVAFKRIDPTVGTTTLMNIIRQTRATRELVGKRFEDLFPFYQAEPHPEFGMIPRPVVEVRIAHPIYCS